MPSRIQNIILRARDTLADPNASRFSDSRLLRLVSEGQQDLVKQAKLLRTTYTLLPVAAKAIYDLPTDVWEITRASFKGRNMDLRTYDDFDYGEANNNYSTNISTINSSDYSYSSWTDTTNAVPGALVYDRLNMHQVRLFPIPTVDISDNIYFFANDFGVITSIDNATFNSLFGVVTSITATDYTIYFDSFYGVLVDLQEAVAPIVINYFQTASEVETLTSNLVISPMFDVALKHFVVGHALRDDLDVQNRQMGSEALVFYERELNVAKKTAAINSTHNRERSIAYTGPFQY